MADWKELVTFGLALLGATLGVINTWRALSRDKVKLRVRLLEVLTNAPGYPPRMLAIEVTNLSAFPVTIGEVGFRVRWSKNRSVIPNPILNDGGPFPRRLQSREQFTAYTSREVLDPGLNYNGVFASTACGVTKNTRFGWKGNSIRRLFHGPPS